jgi:A/G-specific adenine glycosylase
LKGIKPKERLKLIPISVVSPSYFCLCMTITETLISWYHQHKRDLPWRSTRDPYRIWLSEVILQQTRVNQGMDYYHRFLERFPDIFALAKASEEEVLKLWQGLGYYSRARNLHHAARTIVSEFSGKFPPAYSSLLNLKGIGEYTAAAIASISFNEAVAVVDGNVSRVLARLFALEEPVNASPGMKLLRKIAEGLIPATDPATFNQAIMEFGALQCTPRKPGCESCPLRLQCLAYAKGKATEYPKKLDLSRVKELYYYYLVITFPVLGRQHILLHKREQAGIWKNMYDFPLVESGNNLEFHEVMASGTCVGLLGRKFPGILSISQEYIHLLSHRRISARFIRIILTGAPKNIGPNIIAAIPDIGKYPVPKLIERYLDAEGLNSRRRII